MFLDILKYKFLGDYTQDFFFKQIMEQSFAGQNTMMFFYLSGVAAGRRKIAYLSDEQEWLFNLAFNFVVFILDVVAAGSSFLCAIIAV